VSEISATVSDTAWVVAENSGELNPLSPLLQKGGIQIERKATPQPGNSRGKF